jgi:hypothetical protein
VNNEDVVYHLENLRALDPDQLVTDLNLTTDELLSAFMEEALEFLEREYG